MYTKEQNEEIEKVCRVFDSYIREHKRGGCNKNAALAWLGGGALAAGGGGMAAGEAFLTLAGPVGWGIIAGVGIYEGYSRFD